MAASCKMRNSDGGWRRPGNQPGKVRCMRIMALVAGKLCLHTAACVPCPIDPAMSSCFPVMVGYAVAFSTEQDGLIAGDCAAVVINIGFEIGTIMAVETAQI